MPLYLIERNFAEQLDLDSSDLENIETVNGQLNVQWLYSFLSADKRKTYCLYQAENPELILEAAKRLNLPADAVVEVDRIAPPA